MEELIFFAVIIFFSILESIARSRKGRSGGDGPQLPELPEPSGTGRGSAEEWTPRLPDLPTYDADPSYDDRATAEPEPRRSAAETMLPADLLEELAGLARRRGEAESRSRTVELPRQSPPLPDPEGEADGRGSRLPSRWERPVPERSRTRTPSRSSTSSRSTLPTRTSSRSPVPVSGRPVGTSEIGGSDHPVHLSHRGYGTDPSERHRFDRPVEPVLPLHADADAVRRDLLSHSASALRRAVILQGVLGPPAALRPERHGQD